MKIKAPKVGFRQADIEKSLKKNTDISVFVKGNEYFISNYMNNKGKIDPKWTDGKIIYVLDKDGKDHKVTYDSIESIEEGAVLEGRVQIKRKYGSKAGVRTNKNAPLRNSILMEFGSGVVTEEDLMSILTKVGEDLGKPYNRKKWFRNNERYFSKIKTTEGTSWTLSRYGRKVYDSVLEPDKRIIMEKLDNSYDEFLENSGNATPGSVNGMGNTALPSSNEAGSGDIPHQLTGDATSGIGATAGVKEAKEKWHGTRTTGEHAKKVIKELKMKKDPKTGEYCSEKKELYVSPIGKGDWEVSFKPSSSEYKIYKDLGESKTFSSFSDFVNESINTKLRSKISVLLKKNGIENLKDYEIAGGEFLAKDLDTAKKIADEVAGEYTATIYDDRKTKDGKIPMMITK